MKTIHNMTITVFVKQDENTQEITEQITTFLPEQFVDENIRIEEEHIKIDEGEDFDTYSVQLKKDRHTKYAVNILKEVLGKEQCNKIANDPTRVDEQGFLYIRIDKQRFLENNNEALLVDHGNCFHFKLMIACYPKTKERAQSVIKELFSN